VYQQTPNRSNDSLPGSAVVAAAELRAAVSANRL
jgi:hypothetical protein